MRQLNRWFGRLCICVGLVGVLLTVLGLVMLWRSAAVFSTRTVAIANLAIGVNDNAGQYIAQTDKVMRTMRQKVSALKQTADKVSDDSQQNREVIPLLQRLDDEIVRELGQARSLLVSIQSGTHMLNQAVGLFDSLSSPVRMFRRSAEPRENSNLSEFSQSLAETSEKIQGVIDVVARMEQRGVTEEEAMNLERAIAGLEEVLDRSGVWLTSLQSFLQTTRNSVVTTRDRVPFWTNVGATFCTVFFVCFGFTQIQLIGFGRSLLARTIRSTASKASVGTAARDGAAQTEGTP